MNENSFYFDHDYNARTDQKILKLRAKFGLEGYGLFWCVIESMACDSTGYLDGSAMDVLSLSFGLPVEKVTEQIQFMLDIGLIEKCSHGNLFNTRIIDHKLFRAERSRTGKKGSDKRWKNQQVNSSANSSANAYDRKGEEIKGKKIKKGFVPPSFEEFSAYCIANGFGNIAERAYKGYVAADWHDAKGQKIFSWKQKLQNGWFRDDNRVTSPKPSEYHGGA